MLNAYPANTARQVTLQQDFWQSNKLQAVPCMFSLISWQFRLDGTNTRFDAAFEPVTLCLPVQSKIVLKNKILCAPGGQHWS